MCFIAKTRTPQKKVKIAPAATHYSCQIVSTSGKRVAKLLRQSEKTLIHVGISVLCHSYCLASYVLTSKGVTHYNLNCSGDPQANHSSKMASTYGIRVLG